MVDKKSKINRSSWGSRISHMRMSTFDSNESFDNKIYLVYWLWLKMYEKGILGITVVHSIRNDTNSRMCSYSKTRRTDKIHHLKKQSIIFGWLRIYHRSDTVFIECAIVYRNSIQNHKNKNKMFSVGMIPNKSQKFSKLVRINHSKICYQLHLCTSAENKTWDFIFNVCPQYEMHLCKNIFLLSGDIGASFCCAFLYKPDVIYLFKMFTGLSNGIICKNHKLQNLPTNFPFRFRERKQSQLSRL